ncbi:MAG: DUF924 family protein [Gammaproteobacteria bacterium]|nr:DUF924 family protein [Gammaproteobacteria bacterium]
MANIKFEDIIEFWFSDSLDSPESARNRSKFWYVSNSVTDDEIRTQFGPVLEAAHNGLISDWEASPEGALALVILLDQFSRNIYRGDAKAYSGDELALAIAKRAVQSGFDQDLPGLQRLFLYHPLHHSEQISDQEKAVALFQNVEDQSPEDWREFLHGFTKFAIHHKDVVTRFGRFPHRNKILHRRNTKEEQAYLDGGASSYGQ